MPETTLQPSIKDSRITSRFPTSNSGASTTAAVGYSDNPYSHDLLLMFDLSTIAKGSKIQKAILSLYVDSVLSAGVWGLCIWRLLQPDWTEDGSTWNTYDGVNPWGSGGAEQEGVDISSALMYGPVNTSGISGGEWMDMELSPSEFQSLIDFGNYGMKFGSNIRDANNSASHTFRTSEHATTATRPKLYVRWIEPSGRLFEYKFNKYDKEKKILNSYSRSISPNELRPDAWMFVEGTVLQTAIAYESLVVDPRTNYIVGVSNNEDSRVVGIEFNRNQFADQIIQRLVRGA